MQTDKDLIIGDVIATMNTSKWEIKIKLFNNLVPNTVNNFVGLAQNNYYNWIIFHRIIAWFMIQTWDPTWTWMWGESIYWETFSDEFHPELSNISYSLSMANAWPWTNWSQFFINQWNNVYLDNAHSVFGQVIEWENVVDDIASSKTWRADKPVYDIEIESIKLEKHNWKQLEDYEINIEEVVKNYKK